MRTAVALASAGLSAHCAVGAEGALGGEATDGGAPTASGELECRSKALGVHCTKAAACGDAELARAEGCDDGNRAGADGCDGTCRVEAGWMCPWPGKPCVAARCGDGIVAGGEECEPKLGAPGCSAECRIEAGFSCDRATLVCARVLCGDGRVERGERCDDGNELPYDGCDVCRLEPTCTAGACTGTCGDGRRFGSEGCDDGNAVGGDGCAPDCTVEPGYTCSDGPPRDTVELAIVARDFIGKDNQLAGAAYHEDFNRHDGSGVLGIVASDLGTDGRPIYVCPDPATACSENPGHLYVDAGGRPNTSTRANFDQWFRSVPAVNRTTAIRVTAKRLADGSYLWDSSDPTANGGKRVFDPVGTGGWVAAGKEKRPDECPDRNVSFTTETHLWFEYRGGESLSVVGDDDTWVFVNGRLAIDLGGLHPALGGRLTLDADTDGAGPDRAEGAATVVSDLAGTRVVSLGLVPGGVYEVVIFQAERNQCGSNFRLAWSGFERPRSTCGTRCGDGVVAGAEACDDGINDGRYGGCLPGCAGRAPRCGDGIVQAAHEECDDGNSDPADGCTNLCLGPGDGR